MDISKMTKIELLERCNELGITKCRSKNKSRLIELIDLKQLIPRVETLLLNDTIHTHTHLLKCVQAVVV